MGKAGFWLNLPFCTSMAENAFSDGALSTAFKSVFSNSFGDSLLPSDTMVPTATAGAVSPSHPHPFPVACALPAIIWPFVFVQKNYSCDCAFCFPQKKLTSRGKVKGVLSSCNICNEASMCQCLLSEHWGVLSAEEKYESIVT